jgi:hypothetical protein
VNWKDFILLVIAIAFGVLIASAVIAKVAAAQVQSLQTNSWLGLAANLLGIKPATGS